MLLGIGRGTAVDQYEFLSGTSMAAPHVTGVCGLLASRYPEESYLRWKARIMTSTDLLPDLEDMTITGGMLNVYKALTVDDLPAVFDMIPYSAGTGETVKIKGYGFGDTQGANFVSFQHKHGPSVCYDTSPFKMKQ